MKFHLTIFIAIFSHLTVRTLSLPSNNLQAKGKALASYTRAQGRKDKVYQELLDQPFAYMEQQIRHAPMALDVMASICILAANTRDFSLLTSDRTEYDLLKFPGSFTASLSQLSEEAYYAFQEADSGMFEIQLKTGDIKRHVLGGVKILLEGNNFEVEQFFPSEMKQLKLIAEACSKRSADIEKRFEHLIAVTYQLVGASSLKKRVTEDTLLEIENLIKHVDDRRLYAINDTIRQEKHIEGLKDLSEDLQNQYISALQKMDVSDNQIAKWAEMDMEEICKPHVTSTRECKSHKGKCLNECINGQCYIREPEKDWDYCTTQEISIGNSVRCDSGCTYGDEIFLWCWAKDGPHGTAGRYWDYCTKGTNTITDKGYPCQSTCHNNKCKVKDVPSPTAACDCKEKKTITNVCNKVQKRHIRTNFGDNSTTSYKLQIPTRSTSNGPGPETKHLVELILKIQKIAQDISTEFMLDDGTLDVKKLNENSATMTVINDKQVKLEGNLEDLKLLEGKTDAKYTTKAKEFIKSLLKTLNIIKSVYKNGSGDNAASFDSEIQKAQLAYHTMFDDGNTTLSVELKTLKDVLLEKFQPIFEQNGTTIHPTKLDEFEESTLSTIKTNLEFAKQKGASVDLVEMADQALEKIRTALNQLKENPSSRTILEIFRMFKTTQKQISQLETKMTAKGAEGANHLIAYQMRIVDTLSDNMGELFEKEEGSGKIIKIKDGEEVKETAKNYIDQFREIASMIQVAKDGGANKKFAERALTATKSLIKLNTLIINGKAGNSTNCEPKENLNQSTSNRTPRQSTSNVTTCNLLGKVFDSLTRKLDFFVAVDIPVLTNEPPHENASPFQVQHIEIPNDGTTLSKKLIAAHSATLSAQFLLDNALERQNMAEQKKLETYRQINKFNTEIKRLTRQGATHEEIAKVLTQGLQLLSLMNEQWKNLHGFFDRMAIFIDHTISNELKRFLGSFNDVDGKFASKLGNFGKKRLFDIAKEVNERAFLVNSQANAYVEASTAFIMPTVNALEKYLFAQDDKKEDEQKFLEAQVQTELPAAYKKIFTKNKEEYEEKLRSNQADVEQNVFGALNIPVPPKKLEALTKEINNDINCKANDYKVNDVESNNFDSSQCPTNDFGSDAAILESLESYV